MEMMVNLIALRRRLGEEGVESEEDVEEAVYQFIMSDSRCPEEARESRTWCKKPIIHPRFGQGRCQEWIEEESKS